MKAKEVKFRGKSKRTGEWLYGDLVRNVEGAFAIVPPFEMTTENLCDRYEVDKNTIGQYTGLTDGNDKEIYEGDIVTRQVLKSFFNYQIVFNNATFCMKTSDDNFVPLMNIFLRSTIVKGNIYDNPELLKR